MDRSKYRRILISCILIVLIILGGQAVLAENIDPGGTSSHHVWNENVGWLNFKPSQGPGVTVSDSVLSGYVWGENIGWINLSPTSGGVVNDGVGNLSGYAWGENVGWINFAPTGGGVTINACGEFNGYAWGENIGWINFKSDGLNSFKLVTAWQSPLDNIPPVTTYSPVLLPWYRTDAIFNFFSTDCGKGTKEIRYRINSNAEIVTTGNAATATVASEACNMLEYYAIDIANNVEPSRSLAVCIDKTPPVVSINAPVNGSTLYINQSPPADFTATDALSGIATVSSTVPLGSTVYASAVGSYSFNVMATDNAGNITPVTASYSVIFPGNMDPGSTGCQYAWGENVGWINFKPTWGPGVTVSDTALTGMAWGENIGWINMNPVYGGVENDAAGNLSGYAWGENVGWINFRPSGGGVTIESDGRFAGYAWGENIGWINFSASHSCVRTTWVPPLPDTTPDLFTFTALYDVALNTIVTSNIITVTGINAPSPVSIIGGQYSINGGSYTSAPGSVNNGDSVRVQLMSSDAYITTRSAVLTIDGVSGAFNVTTENMPVDTTPDPFVFTAQMNVTLNTLVTSNAITVTGINAPAWISITGGEYSINGGVYTSVSNTTTFVNAGDTVRVRQTSSGSYGTTTHVVLTIGGVNGTFSVTTVVADTTPDPFTFESQTNVPLNTLVTSNTITVTGINAPTWIAITGGEHSINGGIFTSVSNTTTYVNPGDTVRVRQASSGSYLTTTNVVLTIGDVSGTFSVTTLPINTDVVSPADPVAVPNAQVDLTFTSVAAGGLVTATPVDPSGPPAPANFMILDGSVYDITTSAIFSGQIMVCIKYDPAFLGGMSENDLRLFHYVSGIPQDITQLPVDTVNKKVCGLTTSLSPFAIAVFVRDTTPDPFAFTDQTGVPLSTAITSNVIIVSGINVPTEISIAGGQYSINGGPVTSATGTVMDGDSVGVQLTSSGFYGTTKTATLTVGSASGTFSVTTIALVFSGFFSPVDNLPLVNIAKAGQAIPVKWRLIDANGGPVSDRTIFKDLGSYQISCSNLTGDPTDTIEEYATGSSGLHYNGEGYWQFNWNTPKTYAGQCRTMVLTLGDGSKHEADFNFSR